VFFYPCSIARTERKKMRELTMQELETVNGGNGRIIWLVDDGKRITAPGICNYPTPGMFGPPIFLRRGVFYVAECRP